MQSNIYSIRQLYIHSNLRAIPRQQVNLASKTSVIPMPFRDQSARGEMIRAEEATGGRGQRGRGQRGMVVTAEPLVTLG